MSDFKQIIKKNFNNGFTAKGNRLWNSVFFEKDQISFRAEIEVKEKIFDSNRLWVELSFIVVDCCFECLFFFNIIFDGSSFIQKSDFSDF